MLVDCRLAQFARVRNCLVISDLVASMCCPCRSYRVRFYSSIAAILFQPEVDRPQGVGRHRTSAELVPSLICAPPPPEVVVQPAIEALLHSPWKPPCF